MKKCAPVEDVNNAASVYGYCVAQTMARLLRQSGDNLTCDNLLEQAASLKNFRPGMLLPGHSMTNGPDDCWPFSALQLVQFNGEEFEPLGQAIQVR